MKSRKRRNKLNSVSSSDRRKLEERKIGVNDVVTGKRGRGKGGISEKIKV